MARRRKKSRSSKLDSVMTIPFALTGKGEEATSTIDISQCASLVNRRFYRQGLEWAVAGFTVLSDDQGTINVQKLPDTWMCDNGYTKAYHAWKRQQDDAIEEAGAESAVAAFRDFKVHMDVTHVTAGFANNLLPVGYGGVGYPIGEWEASNIVVPNVIPDASGSTVDPTEYMLHTVGVNNNAGVSRGIIEGYADSRAYPQSPDPVSPGLDSDNNWLRDMFDVGNDSSEIVDNAIDTNDQLPYDQVNYPGGETIAPVLEISDQAIASATTIGGKSSLKGSNYKCGLIRVLHDFPVPSSGVPNIVLLLHLVPGNHRGYLAERMT